MSYGASAQTAKGPALGLAALVLGLVGVVVTFLPVHMHGERPYLALAFGLPGFVISILGLLGHRRGKGFAVAGALLSLLAVLIGVITIGNVLS
jgi:hypothetical protein